MLSKSLLCKSNLEANNIFACPICSKSLLLLDNSLICENNHSFNISKKGSIFLINNPSYKNSDIYNSDLFVHRRNFINNNFYTFIYSYISDFINTLSFDSIKILDLGCGEGLHSLMIQKNINKKSIIYGLDYSKDAINLATDFLNYGNIYFCGDINFLPLIDSSIDIVIDFLSPYNALEIKRILKKNGYIIKVVPGKNYLKELRTSFNLGDYEKIDDVKNNLKKHFNILFEKEIINEFDINDSMINDLIYMTPVKNKNFNNISFKKITIDMIIYILKVRENNEKK